jgi:hypothetical protein
VQRDRGRLLVGDRRHHRQVQVLLVAGHVEDAQGRGCMFQKPMT